MFYKIPNPLKFHIPSTFENNDPAMWVRAEAWVTGECLGKLHRQDLSKKDHLLKDTHLSPQPHPCPGVPEYAPLNHHTHLSKHFFWMSNTITLIFLFLNQLYKYRRLEKFTVHSLSPFSFMNVMLLFLGKPQISSQNRWLWKIKLSETSISIFQ